MSRPSPRLLLVSPLLLLLPAVAASAATPDEILRKSDLSAHSPVSFRARLRITAGEGTKRGSSEVEVWNGGETRTLVRFLDEKERGKYLIRRDGTMYFLSPGTKAPMKLTPAYRLRGGASLDEILGIHYARDYEVEKATEDKDGDGALDVLDLKAKAKGAPYPKIRYVVRRATGLPVRAEYRLPSGKVASVAEFVSWDAKRRDRLTKLVLKDPLRPGAPTEVAFLELDEKPVPEGLFDLANGDERKKLEAAKP